MNSITRAGFSFAFDPSTCRTCRGRCCNGVSGYVFADEEEIAGIAGFLGMGVYEFGQRFLRRVESRYSLLEVRKGDNYACVLFDEGRNGCSIYPVRPRQCREFPFWEPFKLNPEGAVRECPGVGMKRN